MLSFNNKNYFQIFSIPESYLLNLDALSETYREIQARVHPDRFANTSEQEKLQAIQVTSLLNEAYETLRSPQKRAAYLLELHGIDVTLVEQSELSPQLLMEQIQIREELEEIPRDEAALEQLDALRRQIDHRITHSKEKFAENLQNQQLKQAKADYYELQYFSKLIAEIEAVEEDLLGY